MRHAHINEIVKVTHSYSITTQNPPSSEYMNMNPLHMADIQLYKTLSTDETPGAEAKKSLERKTSKFCSVSTTASIACAVETMLDRQ